MDEQASLWRNWIHTQFGRITMEIILFRVLSATEITINCQLHSAQLRSFISHSPTAFRDGHEMGQSVVVFLAGLSSIIILCTHAPRLVLIFKLGFAYPVAFSFVPSATGNSCSGKFTERAWVTASFPPTSTRRVGSCGLELCTQIHANSRSFSGNLASTIRAGEFLSSI